MDARIERTRTAVMDAATELLLEGGPSAITMDGVVALWTTGRSVDLEEFDLDCQKFFSVGLCNGPKTGVQLNPRKYCS